MRNGILPFSVKTAAVATPPAPAKVTAPRPGTFQTKNKILVRFAVKADSIDEEERTFEGLASVWGKDLGDDNMHKGAFKQTIKDWKSGSEAIPLLNSHNHWDVMSAVGQLLDAKETDDGLWTKWEIIKGPDGDRVLERLRPGSNGRSPVGKMSIGFEPTKIDFEKDETARFGQVRNLRAVNLKEVSLVLFPMAPGASIDASSVKSFLEDAAAMKPEEVDEETKTYLRKVASRIGVLLAGKKAPETAEPSAPTTEPKTPATPAKAAVQPQSTPTGEEEDTGAEGKAGEQLEEGKYQFSEALSKRIQSATKAAAKT